MKDILLDIGTPGAAKELKQRIEEVITYGRLPVIQFEWTRKAYDDLTSGGTPFVEPAQQMIGHREMNNSELADAIQEVVQSFPVVPGEVREMLYRRVLTLCIAPKSSLKESRCLKCKGCTNYIGVINEIRGIGVQHSEQDSQDQVETRQEISYPGCQSSG